jgi:hypothetical protein
MPGPNEAAMDSGSSFAPGCLSFAALGDERAVASKRD